MAEGKMKWTEVCKEFYVPFKKNLTLKRSVRRKTGGDIRCPLPALRQADGHQIRTHGQIPRLPRAGRESHAPDARRSSANRRARRKDQRRTLSRLRQTHEGPARALRLLPRLRRLSHLQRRLKDLDKTGFKCPNCLESPDRKDKPGDIVLKKSRGRGKPFYACNRWPDCTFIMNKRPESEEELQAALKYWKENPPKPKKSKFIK